LAAFPPRSPALPADGQPTVCGGPNRPKYSPLLQRGVGLPLRDLVHPEELPWEALAGRSLAVDGYNALYQFLATIRQPDGRLFTDAEGRVTSHLMGLLNRTASLLAEGVRPVWVMDGKAPDRKAGTLSQRFRVKERAEEAWKEALAAGDLELARRKAAATSHLSREMVAEAVELLAALGVPSVQAPSEGEAQAARMAAEGLVWAAASEDYDCLLFGAPRLVRGLAARAPKGKALGAQVIDRAQLLSTLGISSEELLLIGLLIGNDYSDGARGFGPKRALKLAQEHLGLEASLRRAGLDPEAVAPVAELFRTPEVVTVAAPVFRAVDPDAVIRLLVDRHGFSDTRVQAALERVRRSPHPASEPPRGRQQRLDAFAPEAS
jgi:flap endonuclease-1